VPSRLHRAAKATLGRWPRLYRWTKRLYGYLTFRLGIPHDQDFAFFANLGEGLLVDIGANTGQSARSVRVFNRQLRIVSFEPNRLLEPELRFTRRLLGPGFEYRMLGLGDRDQTLTLYVPMAGRTPLSPWATADRPTLERNRKLIEAESGGPVSVAEVPVEVRRFDELGLHPLAVKIDVEGFELAVLRGMRETLERDEPILMLENNSSAEAAAACLRGLGYRTFAYDVDRNALIETGDLCGTANYFACTTAVIERLGQFADLAIELAAGTEPSEPIPV
jgi:FkbM family methyltransferase